VHIPRQFHDRQCQDRENFQTESLHESNIHGQTLNQIFGSGQSNWVYAQGVNRETLNTYSTYSSPVSPVSPAILTNFAVQSVEEDMGLRGSTRGESKLDQQSGKQLQLRWR
jgi:hypothetical protein